MDAVDLVRDFNRYYTRRLGVLTDRYLGQGRPLGEARLLFEIGDGSDLRDLRTRLGLDSGYLSRLLRSLADQGLVEVRAHPGDGRVRIATLTAAGVQERVDLDGRSRDDVGVLLGRLTPAQQDRLIAAQRQVRELVRLAGVTIEAVPDDSDAARGCLRDYAAELAVRFPGGYDDSALLRPGELSGVTVGGRALGAAGGAVAGGAVAGGAAGGAVAGGAPGGAVAGGAVAGGAPGGAVAGNDDLRRAAQMEFAPNGAGGAGRGAFLLASEDGRPVGCGVWQRMSGGAAEIRHLWVGREARGLGLGRRLLAALEADAAEHGITTLRLGTHFALTEAIGLYRSSGYQAIPVYGDSPYNQLALEKSL